MAVLAGAMVASGEAMAASVEATEVSVGTLDLSAMVRAAQGLVDHTLLRAVVRTSDRGGDLLAGATTFAEAGAITFAMDDSASGTARAMDMAIHTIRFMRMAASIRTGGGIRIHRMIRTMPSSAKRLPR